ncbi:hypothetical protein JCM10450v2_000895 [Rhodotorula kratochvilovae]
MQDYTLRESTGNWHTRSYVARTVPRRFSALLSLVLLVGGIVAFALGHLRYALVGLPLLAFALSRSVDTTETLAILPLGVQLAHTRSLPVPPIALSRSTRFLTRDRIAKIVINEGLQGASGRAYLAVVEKGDQGKVHVVFPNILPRREDLEPVWKAAQSLLS